MRPRCYLTAADRAMDGESENSIETELASLLCSGKVALVTFFAAAEKVTRRQANAVDVKRNCKSHWIPAFAGMTSEERAGFRPYAA